MDVKLLRFAPIISILVVSPVYSKDSAPAVSSPNAKVEMTSGISDGSGVGIGSFSGSLPLGHSFGMQVDGALGQVGNKTVGGVGNHLFWRDPSTMLFGVTGMWSRVERATHDLERGGLETEFYLDEFTLSSSAGGQWDARGKTGYASFGVTYYATPNLALSSQVSGFSNNRLVQFGAEFRPQQMESSSFFIDTGIDNDHKAFALAGIRFSIGAPSKTLRKRDRYDDPINIVSSMMSASAPAVITQTSKPTVATTVASGGGGGGGGIC
jgi:hypothetical protein